MSHTMTNVDAVVGTQRADSASEARLTDATALLAAHCPEIADHVLSYLDIALEETSRSGRRDVLSLFSPVGVTLYAEVTRPRFGEGAGQVSINTAYPHAGLSGLRGRIRSRISSDRATVILLGD